MRVVSVSSGVLELMAPCFHRISIITMYTIELTIPPTAKQVNTMNWAKDMKLFSSWDPSLGGVPPGHFMPLINMPLSLPELLPIGTLMPFKDWSMFTSLSLSPSSVKCISPVRPVKYKIYVSIQTQMMFVCLFVCCLFVCLLTLEANSMKNLSQSIGYFCLLIIKVIQTEIICATCVAIQCVVFLYDCHHSTEGVKN